MTDKDQQPNSTENGGSNPAATNGPKSPAVDNWPWAHVLGFDTAKEWGLDAVIPRPSSASPIPDPSSGATGGNNPGPLDGLSGHTPLQGQNLIEYAMQKIEQALGQPMQAVPPLSSYSYDEYGNLTTTASATVPAPAPQNATPETSSNGSAPTAADTPDNGDDGDDRDDDLTDEEVPPRFQDHDDTLTTPSRPTSGMSSPTGPQSYRVDLIRDDGRVTRLEGSVTYGDLYRPLLPELSGNAQNAQTPDWSITLDQLPNPGPTGSDTDAIVTARLDAAETPADIRQWALSVGPQDINTARLALDIPATLPSLTRASIIGGLPSSEWHMAAATLAAGGVSTDNSGTSIPDAAEPVAPASLGMDQQLGTIDSTQDPFIATLRITSAITSIPTSIPVQLQYTGALPSPILQGDVPLTTETSLSLRMQVIAPNDGKSGATLVALILRGAASGFSVTAQLRGDHKISTPTAMLGCIDPGQDTECRAESMIANATSSLQTSLISITDTPDDDGLAAYGFVLPAPSGNDSTTDATQTDKPDKGTNIAKSAPAKPASVKGKAAITDNTNSPPDADSNNGDTGTTATNSPGKPDKGAS
ncbi:hypothetical protein [Thalassospira permensis]|uniref:Uncharacterized protein n=1 Tax=Thalassospira permensis NBRC 106175 TaxID=1353532 RepID=A0ABR4TLH6_9PROT|nr:hypothetical protein [Thalassospira permensis]KEO54971.1 hypothetical protein SMB34_19950 [Thalassospira permensis NBRC 106175]